MPPLAARIERLATLSRGSTRQHAAEVRAGQWLTPEASTADQRRRLAALLAHASRHVPYYREVFSSQGLATASAEALAVRFTHLPLLDKATLRARFDDLQSDDLQERTWRYDSTGGSTGEPVRLINDSTYLDWQRAVGLVAAAEILCRPLGEKRLHIWGSVDDLLTGKETLRARLGQWLRNEIWLNSFRLTPELMSSYVDIMNRSRPEHIIAYVESAVEIARFVERNGLTVHSPKTVATAAGCLQPHMRDLLTRVFRAEVFQSYGSREVSGMAFECNRHAGMHVPVQTVFLEVLRDDGTPAEPGETGRIVVTSLVNYALPLIRYEIGDLGVWADAPCDCGRVWPLLREITGRVSDTFVTADGTLVAGQYFNYAFHLQDWIEKFQVIQESTRHVRARIVQRKDLPDIEAMRAAGISEITRRVQLAMGEECAVSFEFVDHIEPSASGKYRFTITKVHDTGDPTASSAAASFRESAAAGDCV
jgi:phenylacetate-CoA ligase